MKQVMNTDETIDYSIAIVGVFDHLEFDQNRGEFQRSIPNACLSKCPVD